MEEKTDKLPDTICWNCKCCTGSDEFPCSWAQDGIPVEGWKAEKGRVFSTSYVKKGKVIHKKEQSYTVFECPLYQRDKKFTTLKEVFEEVSRVTNTSLKAIYSQRYYKFKKYERLTGEKLPLWAYGEDKNV